MTSIILPPGVNVERGEVKQSEAKALQEELAQQAYEFLSKRPGVYIKSEVLALCLGISPSEKQRGQAMYLGCKADPRIVKPHRQARFAVEA